METLKDYNIYHALGKRDVLCELFCDIRILGVEKTLQNYSEMLVKICDNPHAKWYKENLVK